MSSQEEAQQAVFKFIVRLVAERQVEPVGFFKNGFEVGKGIKAGLAVVGAHATIANTTEGHAMNGEVDDGIVYAAAAKGQVLGKSLFGSFIGGEEVGSQGPGAGKDKGFDILPLIPAEHGQNGAEDFLLHAGGIRGHAIEQGGFYTQGFFNPLPADYGSGIIHKPHEASKVALTDDVGEVFILHGVLTEHFCDSLAELGYEEFLAAAMNQQIIGRDAGLPGIENFAEGYAAGSHFDIGSRVHNTGAFATQFQGNGGEVACGGIHDMATDAGTAGEEDIVEFFLQQCVGILVSAEDDLDILRREDAAEHFCQHR